MVLTVNIMSENLTLPFIVFIENIKIGCIIMKKLYILNYEKTNIVNHVSSLKCIDKAITFIYFP